MQLGEWLTWFPKVAGASPNPRPRRACNPRYRGRPTSMDRPFPTLSSHSASRLPILTVFLAIVLAVLPAPALQAQDADLRQHRILYAATFPDVEPEYGLDRAGRPTGFAVDLMNAVASLAGLPVQYQTFLSMAAALTAMESGQIDVIPLVTGMPDEQRGMIGYSAPVMDVPVTVFVHADADEIADSFTGIDSLDGLRTAVIGGSGAEVWLMGNPGIITLPYPNIEQALVALLSGRVDALIYPAPSLLNLARISGVADQIQIAGRPLVQLHRRMAIGRVDSALADRLQRSVDAFVGTSEHAALIVKWYGEPPPIWHNTALLWSGGMLALLLAAGMFAWRFITVQRLYREQQAHIMALQVATGERDEAEDTAERHDARYRGLVEGSIQGVMVTRDFKVLFANQAYADMHGFDSPEEMLALDSILSLYAPHEHEKMRANREARLRGETPPARYEYEGRTKDGETMWVESVNQLIEWEGEPAIQAAVVDITKRKLAQFRLEQSEARAQAQATRTRHLLDSSPQALVVVDAAGRITSVNQKTERLFDYTQAEMLGQPVEMLVPERLREAHVRQRETFFEQPAIRTMGLAGQTILGLRKDGSEFNAETTLYPDMGEGGMRVLAWISDVSERVKLEEQFRGAQRMEVVGRLAGGIAHDFNNMLAVILSYSGFLLESIPVEDSRREDVEQIQAAAERSAALTKQLLLFSRRQPLRMEETDLNAVVAGMEKMLRRVIGEDITLACRFAQALGHIVADKSQLEQVLMNLCVNARDAMPTGGHLHIETDQVELDDGYARDHIGVQPGTYVVLSISDTGMGMDKETQSRIFEPFFTTKGQGAGTGLGLSTVFGVIKQMEGNVWVYSELGQGTTFKIYMPLAPSAHTAKLATEDSAMETKPRKSATVLLVEDEDLVRKTAHRILTQAGYSVIQASHGAQALDIAANGGEAIDLLLTDVVMPRMNGVEVAAGLSSIYPDVKVLYMSGYTEDAISSHGVLDPGVRIVFKPFTKGSLLNSVSEALSG